MIDRALIDKDRLLEAMLDSVAGNVNQWWRLAEVVPDYMPPFPREGDRPMIVARCLVLPDEPIPGPGVVTCRYAYLRTSGHAGWQFGGYFWDMYGTDFVTVEYAMLAILHAPVPPQLLKSICWKDAP